MKRVTTIATACVLAAFAVLVTQVARRNPNATERTFMTFSSAVELPGVTLEAWHIRIPARRFTGAKRRAGVSQRQRDIIGQWTFCRGRVARRSATKRGDVQGDRGGRDTGRAVLVFPEREDRQGVHLSKGSGCKDCRADRTDGPCIRWPGHRNGDRAGPEGVPPNGRAAAEAPTRVRKRASSAAAASAGSTDRQSARVASAVTRSETPRSERTMPAPQVAAQADPAPRPSARGIGKRGSRAAGTAGAQQRRENELPDTASPLALSGLIGLLSLAGAVGLRAIRR